MKSCLVIEGGGMRGIYAAGATDAFLDYNIGFDAVIGVSAGAIHGCTFIAGQRGRNVRYTKKYCADKRFMSVHSLITTGSLVGEQFCYHDIPDRLDPFDYDAFKASHTDFFCVCTDVEKGTPVYIKCTDLRAQMDCLLASASLPMVSKIVEACGRKLLDGGISDSIPVEAALKMGYDKIVVIRTRTADYRKKYEGSSIGRLMYGKKYPELVRAIENRHIMYNHQQEYINSLAREGKIVSVQPSRTIEISRTEKDPDVINEMYLLGKHDAEEMIDDIRKYLDHPINSADLG